METYEEKKVTVKAVFFDGSRTSCFQIFSELHPKLSGVNWKMSLQNSILTIELGKEIFVIETGEWLVTPSSGKRYQINEITFREKYQKVKK